jgi:hypothetical protein
MNAALQRLLDAHAEIAEHNAAPAHVRSALLRQLAKAEDAYEASRPAPPDYTIEDMLVTEDRTGVALEVDSPKHERRYVVELKFDPMADDRLAMVKHCANDGEGCRWQTTELPVNEVRDLERWLECDPEAVRMIENEWAEVRMLWNR